MTRNMFGPLVLLAASVTPVAPAAVPAAQHISNYQPSNRATATATVSIRVISGVQFGANHQGMADGAERRKAQLTDADGIYRPAELLEFQ